MIATRFHHLLLATHPMTIHINGEPRPFVARTVAELLQEMGLAGQRVAVEINGDVVPRSHHATHAIQERDRIEVVRAIGGG